MIAKLLISLSTAMVVGQANLLTNNGFESGLSGWQTRGPADFTVDSVQYHGGAKSARIFIADGVSLNYQQIYCTVSSAIIEGEKYSASVWVLSQGVTTFPGAYFYIEFQDYLGNRVGIVNETRTITAGASGWEELRIDSALVPVGAAKLNIGFILHAEGTAWFDDASLFLVKAASGADTSVVAADTAQPVCKAFTGFGAEWDSYAYEVNGVTDTDFQTVIRPRVEYMRLPTARVMIMLKYGYLNNGAFDYETEDMKRLYRHLDVCQSLGTTVLLTDWGVERSWTVPAGSDITLTDDTLYAHVIGDYLDYLINTKGYTCIRYFILVNEPNFEVGDFWRWARGVQNVANAITVRGLQDQVSIAGSDMSGNDDWHTQAVDNLKNTLGSYDFHRYAAGSDILSGALESYIQGKWDYALSRDTAAYRKLFIIGEAGLGDGASTGQNSNIETFDYGVIIADYALQSARAGSGAVSAWMLDDDSHSGFTWGMWRNKSLGFGLKQWFYPWSLLCRYFPAGASTYKLSTGIAGFRGLAARKTGIGDAPDAWAFCMVNRTTLPRTARISLPGGGPVSLSEYLYSPASSLKDSNGFPVPVSNIQGDLDSGVYVTCPANAVWLATSDGADTGITALPAPGKRAGQGAAALITAYPSPFNPSCRISFTLPHDVRLQLTVHAPDGRLVRTLAKGLFKSGTHCVSFNGAELATGVYVCRLMAGGNTLTCKIIAVK